MVDNYDPMSIEATRRAAHDVFGEMRKTCPVHYYRIPPDQVLSAENGHLVAAPTEEFWTAFTYADCMRVLQDADGFSSRQGPGPERAWALSLNEHGMLLTADEPAHRRQRRIVGQFFIPRMVEQRRALIQSTMDSLVDRLGPQGRLDVIDDVAKELTVTLVADIIGIGQDRKSDVQRWAVGIVAEMGGGDEGMEQAVAAMGEVMEYIGGEIALRREALARGENMPDDLLGTLLTAVDVDGGFSDEEVLDASALMLLAGYETTTSAIGNAIYLLCTHPEERKKLESDWTLIDNAIEETLRFDSGVEGTFRTTTKPITLHGCEIPADAKVRVVYASANRDETVFDDPHTFRIDRDPKELRKHVAFAHGIHSCIGSALARAELRAAVGTLFKRLPGLELDPDRNPVENISITINGYRSLPVRWDPTNVRPREEQPGSSSSELHH